MATKNFSAKNFPSVSEVLESPQVRKLMDRINRNSVVEGIRNVLDDVRQELRNAASDRTMPDLADLAERVARHLLQDDSAAARPVINATGIPLHSGLGRIPWAASACEAVSAVVQGYANTGLSLETGESSGVQHEAQRLLKELCGAEAALVVPNAAAAGLLAFSGLCATGNVVVARRELFDRGEGYRLAETIAASGAGLREVGSANVIELSDYRHALDDQAAALLHGCPGTRKAEPSVEAAGVAPAELAALAQEHSLPLIVECEAALLRDCCGFGLELPVVSELLNAGADLVLFRGDRLLGGPACGLIVGKSKYLDRLAELARLRGVEADKTTLAALSATLRLHRDPQQAEREIPLLQLLAASPANLRNRAERLMPQITVLEAVAAVEVVESKPVLDNGMPASPTLTGCALAITPGEKSGGLEHLARKLRTGKLPLIGLVDGQRLLLDLRSVFAHQDRLMVETLSTVAGAAPAEPIPIDPTPVQDA